MAPEAASEMDFEESSQARSGVTEESARRNHCWGKEIVTKSGFIVGGSIAIFAVWGERKEKDGI